MLGLHYYKISKSLIKVANSLSWPWERFLYEHAVALSYVVETPSPMTYSSAYNPISHSIMPMTYPLNT